MDEEPPKFTRNKRLVDNGDGSHVGGAIGRFPEDPFDVVKLNRRGMKMDE